MKSSIVKVIGMLIFVCFTLGYAQSKNNENINVLKYENKVVHPACIYALMQKLNGDNNIGRINLSCSNSNEFSQKTVSKNGYLTSTINNWNFGYKVHTNLGKGVYEIDILTYPLKSGSYIGKNRLIIQYVDDCNYILADKIDIQKQSQLKILLDVPFSYTKTKEYKTFISTLVK